MNIDEARAARDQEREHRAEIAGSKVAEMRLPQEIETRADVLKLGRQIAYLYKKVRLGLVQELGVAQSRTMAVALHEFWFACWDGATFFQMQIDNQSFNDNEYTRELATPTGYADDHGWASTLANGFADVVPSAARKSWIEKLTGSDIIEVSVAFRCMAVYWFNQAEIEFERGNVELAFDLVHEAHDALAMHTSDITWKDAFAEGAKAAEELLAPKVRSELARRAGLAAQVESQALKAEVKEFWLSNISPAIGNDAAATILVRQFPLAFRTLSKYVSEFKNTVS